MMKKIKIYCVIMVLTALALKSRGQKSYRNTFYLTFNSGINQKAIVNKETGNYELGSSVMPFAELGGDVQHPLCDKLNVIIGLRFTAYGRNVIFDAPVDKINPGGYTEPYPLLKDKKFDLGISMPLFIERNWNMRSQSTNLFARAGVQLHYSLGYGFDDFFVIMQDENNNNIEVLSMNLNSNNNGKPWLTYTIEGGCKVPLKNLNILKVGVIANISFSHIVDGVYSINIPGEDLTKGTYKSNGSYVGVSVAYGFTRQKKHLKKT